MLMEVTLGNGIKVARARKFYSNVTSHIKIIIMVINDLQIFKCDINFENRLNSALEGYQK